METSQYVLASRPTGMPSTGNFRIEKVTLGGIKENEVLLKSWYISVDPYMRGRMNLKKSYAASWEIDKPVKGAVVAKVVESKSKAFLAGDIVTGS